MKLETERLILRDLKKTDVNYIHLNANDLTIAQSIPVIDYPYLRKHAVSFVNHCIKESNKKPRLNYEFCINLKPDNKAIGMISMTKVDRFNETCTIGYWLGKQFRERGIMYEALKKMIDFAFKSLKIRRINIEANADNIASNVLINKIGFTYEGTARKYVRDKATKKLHDKISYGMLRKDWLK